MVIINVNSTEMNDKLLTIKLIAKVLGYRSNYHQVRIADSFMIKQRA